MTYFARRTCTQIGAESGSGEGEGHSRPLEEFRDQQAYVLLGAPGAGKTEAFETEARECSEGLSMPTRSFLKFDDKPEWHGKTLFIDGLDEVRAGAVDGRTPLDEICKRLYALGKPRFRLSCRHADWFGANDRTNLEEASEAGSIAVIQLDPLLEDDIRRILVHNHDVEDPDTFIASARDKGIEGLLENPQNLKMLAEAVADGEWPEARTQTLELACGKLALDPNREHRIANADRPDVSHLLDAAGRLCAVQLLSGGAGYALEGDAADDPDYPGLEHISGKERRVLRHALCTRLFEEPTESLSSEGRRIPAHRQTAEFLAARYLAGLIENGLPLGRILALMTGHDGVVVSELRGLCAWLAAQAKTSRAQLIERDPLGTILYGDVRDFSITEKRRLIDGIKREAKRNPWLFSVEHSNLGDLATPDMNEVFRQILTDSARDDACQSLMVILLKALIQGSVHSNLAPLVTEIVRDDTWEHGVRSTALDVLVRQHQGGDRTSDELGILLEDIHSGAISDPDDDLLGVLLIELYPDWLSSSDILRHLRPPRNPSYFGRYCSFWIREVPETSTNAQRVDLLDMFVERFIQLESVFHTSPGQSNYVRRVPFRILRKLLQDSQEPISPNQLFAWLGLASDPKLRASARDREFFRTWLDSHPDDLKALIDFGLAHCANCSDFSRCVHDMERRLFMTPLSARLERLYLERATSCTNPHIADYLICRVADSVYSHPHEPGPSRQEVIQPLAQHDGFLRSFNQRLAFLEQNDTQERRIRECDDEEKRRRQQEWCDHIRRHEGALRTNQCEPTVLHQIAMAYFGQYVDVEGDTPRDRIGDLVGDDEILIQTILNGLRTSIARNDLPGEVEVLALGAHGSPHPLTLPFMAGLEEAVRVAPNGQVSLDERQIRLAATIFYTLRMPRTPAWLAPLLGSRPELVSDVLVRALRSRTCQGADLSSDFSELARVEDYAGVARLAALPLLQAFPVRCKEGQLRGLGYLLQTALLHCEEAPLLKLIERKLARSSMNMGQRVHWLVAGLVASPSTFLNELEGYIAGRERRVRCLALAVAGLLRTPKLVQLVEMPALELLIRLVGASFRPWAYGANRGRVRMLTPAMEASDLVRSLIDRLASDPSESATEILESLALENDLHPWRSPIRNAAYRQNAIRREAGFRHCKIERVLEVLDNRAPANAADLAALTTDCLREIARQVRDGNTSDWRQYWNVDSYNRPLCPKPEDACRDALLSALQARLQRLGIDAAPEGQYANDKRSDIRVVYGGFNVPIEVKKSGHGNLWSAIRTQLMAKYTRDPGARRYGIYLVFWFGETDCQPPESGPRPQNAAELEERLRNTLTMDEAKRISILEVDVSKPQT